MNIREAKEEIMRTVRAYLLRDEDGSLVIPRERQRPVLLMGPPGIGKTAVMRQIAEEMGIGLVSYTITHHTRQSAIGLPMIATRDYGGKEYSVTEYTMSEIVASIYDRIGQTGIREGILFLDEINCVSETLAPTMLQFLQYKTFGAHEVPEGFVIVTAGNPPEYNRSVRDFDLVTLDRVKRLDVEADLDVWKEYALGAGVHGAVLAYLSIRKEHFYSIRSEVSGRRFVTARGWEDLSESLKAYEALGQPVGEAMVSSFLMDPEIAKDFTAYYEFWQKYSAAVRVPDILEGAVPEGSERLSDAPFDEKMSLLGLFNSALMQEFRERAEETDIQKALFGILKEWKATAGGGQADGGTGNSGASFREFLAGRAEERRRRMETLMSAHLLGRDAERRERGLLKALSELSRAEDFAGAKELFAAREAGRGERAARTGAHLTNAFGFIARVFGEGQEMVLFLSGLSAGKDCLRFVRENGNDAYYKYNRMLLLRDREEALRGEVMKLI